MTCGPIHSPPLPSFPSFSSPAALPSGCSFTYHLCPHCLPALPAVTFPNGSGAASSIGAGSVTSSATSAGSFVSGHRSLLGSTAGVSGAAASAPASTSVVTTMTGMAGVGSGAAGQHAAVMGGADRPLCSMAAAGVCLKGEACTMLHGDLCPHCGRMCLHPYRLQVCQEHVGFLSEAVPS